MTDPAALLPLTIFTNWLASGERGISSEAIVSQLTGASVGRRSFRGDDHPYDPADFRRCEALLDAYPIARVLFPRMADRSPAWAALVAHWDEIAGLLREEMAQPGHSAPKTYDRMKAVLKEAKA